MKNILGITGVKTKIIEVNNDKTDELNFFLATHDGDIIDIQTVGMAYGVCKFVIVYKGYKVAE